MYPVFIHPIHIQELKEIEEKENAIKFGASMTLAEIESVLQYQIKTKDGTKS